MKRETIEKILNFLNEKEGKELPQKWVNLIKKIELIKELENHPDGTQYKHYYNLLLSDSNITKLPNDLYVGGFLDLRNCQELTELPDKLHVGSYFSLSGCKQLTELPNKLFVGGFFRLDSCKKITELPDKLHVGDDLDLSGTNITTLPDNLYVGGFLDIYNTPLAKKYSNEEIYEIVASTGGKINGPIIRFL